jgi:hypothetical protein
VVAPVNCECATKNAITINAPQDAVEQAVCDLHLATFVNVRLCTQSECAKSKLSRVTERAKYQDILYKDNSSAVDSCEDEK